MTGSKSCRSWRTIFDANFTRFAVVGLIGFVVDALVLLALIAAGNTGPVQGRFLSFTCAVLVTFDLNRRWSFDDAAPRRYLPALLVYIGVQGVGFLVNLAVYSLALVMLPTPLNAPLVCLALASGLVLVVNFTGTRFLVFRRNA